MAIGDRLREERKKLKATQAEFAQLGGIGVSALKMYEGNDREPGAIFLAEIAEAGIDVQYVITGQHSNGALTPDERVLLDGYRSLDPMTRRRMLAFMLTESGPVAVQKKIQEKTATSSGGEKYRGAKIGSISEGDFTGTAHIQVGGKREK